MTPQSQLILRSSYQREFEQRGDSLWAKSRRGKWVLLCGKPLRDGEPCKTVAAAGYKACATHAVIELAVHKKA